MYPIARVAELPSYTLQLTADASYSRAGRSRTRRTLAGRPMALFATLLHAELPCPRCGKPIASNWQFYFGAVSQFPTYCLGDRVLWDEPARYGDPSMSLVHAVAYSVNEPACPSCPVPSIIGEILIEDGIILRIESPRDCWHLPELLYEGTARVPRFFDDLYRD